MIRSHDEFLHNIKKKGWIESYNISVIDKKNKAFGYIYIESIPEKKVLSFMWTFFILNRKYEYSKTIKYKVSETEKKITDSNCELIISKPLENFKLSLKNEFLTAKINITGLCPIYDFPANILNTEKFDNSIIEVKLWDMYQQRCKMTGEINLKKGDHRGKKVRIDCFGHRDHSWGVKPVSKIKVQSYVTVQFRDMSMNLLYIEDDKNSMSNGFTSKKSGNIPISHVECESVTVNSDKNLTSSELSYKDAQDDVDLLVSKATHSSALPVLANKSKFAKYIAFSDFTIIGTNKKGTGIEEHYITVDKIKKLQASERKR